MKKVVLCALSASMILSAFGCGKKADTGRTADGKVILTLVTADQAANPKGYEQDMARHAEFEALNPDIHIEPSNFGFDVRDYAAKAAGNQLPTYYYVPLTEAKNCIEMGYAKDIKPWLDKLGYTEYLSDFILKNIEKDGGIYFYPTGTYEVGIIMNKSLAEKAGYVAADGTPHQPKTWEEFAEMAVNIKKATGAAGFTMPSMNNCGGWRFLPIAWSYGVDFMEKIDGKWTATFNTQECVDALQFVKDLKWKYDVIPANFMTDNSNSIKQFASGEAAMAFSEPSSVVAYQKSGFNKDDVCMVQLPAGPKRHVTLLGGGYNVFNGKSTDEQIEAAFKYMEWDGTGSALDDNAKAKMEEDIQLKIENKEIVGLVGISPWKDDYPKRQYELELAKKYCNVNENQIKIYNDKNTGIEYQEEEPVECQALYSVLDSCVQAVWTDKNADCAALIADAARSFQANYLDYVD